MKIEKLLHAFAETIPDEQILSYQRTLKMISYTIGARNPAGQSNRNTEYGMWVSYDTLNELLRGSHDHCMMCDLDTVGRKKCPLRKGLDKIPNDVPDRDDGDCPYYTVM